METYYINNGEERFGFIVEIEKKEHIVNFKIYHIHSIDGSEKIEVPCVEQTVSGSIKWDGCSDVNYGNNGYIHFCGIEDQITQNECIKFVWEQSAKHFDDVFEEPDWDSDSPTISSFTSNFRIEKN